MTRFSEFSDDQLEVMRRELSPYITEDIKVLVREINQEKDERSRKKHHEILKQDQELICYTLSEIKSDMINFSIVKTRHEHNLEMMNELLRRINSCKDSLKVL